MSLCPTGRAGWRRAWPEVILVSKPLFGFAPVCRFGTEFAEFLQDIRRTDRMKQPMDQKLATAFLASAFALGMICGVAGPARAAGSGTATGFETAVAVEADELALHRGAGLDAAAGAQGGEDRLAVILWDEYKPRSVGSTVKLDNGVGSSLTSSISGIAQ